MKHRTTQLLLVTLLIGAVACGFAYARLRNNRDAAGAAREDVLKSKAALDEIIDASSGGARAASANLDQSELNRRLRDAAQTAGIAQKLVSIEPGQPNRIPNADYNEMLVFLRLEPVSLKQLVTFLHELGTSDRSCRARNIELRTPTENSADTWSADITMAYLIYSPREEGS
jgi:hypothetical protein